MPEACALVELLRDLWQADERLRRIATRKHPWAARNSSLRVDQILCRPAEREHLSARLGILESEHVIGVIDLAPLQLQHFVPAHAGQNQEPDGSDADGVRRDLEIAPLRVADLYSRVRGFCFAQHFGEAGELNLAEMRVDLLFRELLD